MSRIVLFVLCVLFPAAAVSSMLPLLDESDLTGAAPWWVMDDAGPEGPVSASLHSGSVPGGARWTAPSDVQRALDSVSRVLRSGDLTPTNAARLAALLGASRALVGTVRSEDAPAVPWLGLRRASLVLEGVLVDARSGHELRGISLRAVAFGQDMDEAQRAAAALLARFVDQAAADVSVSAGADLPVRDDEPVVIVRSDGGAVAYVAVRAALREVHPGVVDLSEVWATGGHVAMRVSLDESVGWDAFRERVLLLEGAARADVLIHGIEDLGAAGLLLRVGIPPATTEVGAPSGN